MQGKVKGWKLLILMPQKLQMSTFNAFIKPECIFEKMVGVRGVQVL